MSTIHKAKGSETDILLIPDVVEFNIPLIRQKDAHPKYSRTLKQKVEDEKKIFFTALTRAKCCVVLFVVSDVSTSSHCFRNFKPKLTYRSQFIKHMKPLFGEFVGIEEFLISKKHLWEDDDEGM